MKVTTQKVGNALTFAGLVVLPLLVAFSIWANKQREK